MTQFTSPLCAEFWQGPNGKLFRIKRVPNNPSACILFVPPLFEEMNRHRHVVTRAAIVAYQCGIGSIVYDAFGTGDSQGDLTDVDLSMWQNELLAQIQEIQNESVDNTVEKSSINIILCLPGSAALLLSPEIVKSISAIQCWQAEFSGKKFVKQLKRLALAQNLHLSKHSQETLAKSSSLENNTNSSSVENERVEIAGYCMKAQLISALEAQQIDAVFNTQEALGKPEFKLTLIEFVDEPENKLALARENQLKKIQQYCPVTSVIIAEKKYWQATELLIPDHLFLAFTQSLQQVNND